MTGGRQGASTEEYGHRRALPVLFPQVESAAHPPPASEPQPMSRAEEAAVLHDMLKTQGLDDAQLAIIEEALADTENSHYFDALEAGLLCGLNKEALVRARVRLDHARYVSRRSAGFSALLALPPCLRCISTIWSNFPPALQIAFAVPGSIRRIAMSPMSRLINCAKSAPVAMPASAMAAHLACPRPSASVAMLMPLLTLALRTTMDFSFVVFQT